MCCHLKNGFGLHRDLIIIDMVNQWSNTELLCLLLEYGTSIDLFDLNSFLRKHSYSFNVLDIFAKNNYTFKNFFDKYEYGFERYELNVQKEKMMQEGPIETIEYLLRNSSFLGNHDIKLLYYAGMAQRLDIVKILIELGANVKSMRVKSIAEIFYAGLPRGYSTIISNNKFIFTDVWEELYLNYGKIAKKIEFKGEQFRLIDDSKMMAEVANALVNSLDNLVVHYFLINGASQNWVDFFPEALKEIINLELHILDQQEEGRRNSLMDMARDGWRSLFELGPGGGDFTDYDYL